MGQGLPAMMLPSQKRLLKSMQQHGTVNIFSTASTPSRDKVPSSVQHLILPPEAGGGGGGGTARRPQFHQMPQDGNFDQMVQDSSFIKWQLAQEKQRMQETNDRRAEAAHLMERRSFVTRGSFVTDAGTLLQQPPAQAGTPPKLAGELHSLPPMISPDTTQGRMFLARRELAATAIQSRQRGRAGRGVAAARLRAVVRAKLTKVYQTHNPRKLDDLEELLAQWAGQVRRTDRCKGGWCEQLGRCG
jgi:hypothetical protein